MTSSRNAASPHIAALMRGMRARDPVYARFNSLRCLIVVRFVDVANGAASERATGRRIVRPDGREGRCRGDRSGHCRSPRGVGSSTPAPAFPDRARRVHPRIMMTPPQQSCGACGLNGRAASSSFDRCSEAIIQGRSPGNFRSRRAPFPRSCARPDARRGRSRPGRQDRDRGCACSPGCRPASRYRSAGRSA